MKTLLSLIVAFGLAQVVSGAEPPKPIGGKQANVQIQQKASQPASAPKTTGSYLDRISVSPYFTIVHDGIDDGESYGAGIALGIGINKFVSIELTATTYSDNDWRDEAVDESAALGRFRLVKNAQETMSLYGLAGVDRDWGLDDWALSVGGGVQLKLAKKVWIFKEPALFGDSRLRAWMSDYCEKTEDIATRLGITLSF